MTLWISWNEFNQIHKNRKIILFGRSEDWIPKTLNKLNFDQIECIIDSNQSYLKQSFNGISIFDPGYLSKIDKSKYLIIITATQFESVDNFLQDLGFIRGVDYICTPSLNDWGKLTQIKNLNRNVLICCSDYDDLNKPRSSELGGGLYILNTKNYNLEKKASGQFRQGTFYNNNFYCVNFFEKKVFKFDNNFNHIESFDIDQSPNKDEKPNACGIDFSQKYNLFAIANSGSDHINIYDERFKFQFKIDFSDIFNITNQGQHHINDIIFNENYIYASFFSFSGNWKKGFLDGGICQFDVNNPKKKPELIISNLWKPHSIEFINGNMSYLDSMRGDFYHGSWNLAGSFQGFMRGLTSDSQYFYIGQSENMYMSEKFNLSPNIMCNAGIYLFDITSKISRFYSLPKIMNIHDLHILNDDKF